MECMTNRFTDPEEMAYFEKCRKYYTQVETFICREDSHFPVGKFSTTSNKSETNDNARTNNKFICTL